MYMRRILVIRKNAQPHIMSEEEVLRVFKLTEDELNSYIDSGDILEREKVFFDEFIPPKED